ncbi:unnamed protein product [Cuscuta epithymum]|uniref:Uncharacterized protein n=1 Tax=Cuscuta epithymum TaxID=186058 RepID=A0AAV0E0B7_9ASTE|nr:unnamed protein product [Cuscuta epithymum]
MFYYKSDTSQRKSHHHTYLSTKSFELQSPEYKLETFLHHLYHSARVLLLQLTWKLLQQREVWTVNKLKKFKYDKDQECKPTQLFMSLEKDQQIRSILTKQRPERLRATNSFSDRAQHSLNAKQIKIYICKVIIPIIVIVKSLLVSCIQFIFLI